MLDSERVSRTPREEKPRSALRRGSEKHRAGTRSSPPEHLVLVLVLVRPSDGHATGLSVSSVHRLSSLLLTPRPLTSPRVPDLPAPVRLSRYELCKSFAPHSSRVVVQQSFAPSSGRVSMSSDDAIEPRSGRTETVGVHMHTHINVAYSPIEVRSRGVRCHCN